MLIAIPLVLLSQAVKADEPTCPEGQHWEGEEGYFTDGECSAYSESECLASHQECTHWYWWFGWRCSNYEQVCDSWSEPECLSYEQVWNEGEGSCVADEPEPEPEPEVIGGLGYNIFATMHHVVWFRAQDGIVDWLTAQSSESRLLCSKTPIDGFAVSNYGHPFFGTGENQFGEHNFFGAGSNYGYPLEVLYSSELVTYHRFEVPSWLDGYFCRAVSKDALGNEVISQEIEL